MKMFELTRRGLIAGAFALTLPLAAFAGSHGFKPETTECIAPANAGGGWDFTCRQVGKTMQDLGLVPGTMQVVNLAGGGGGVAYAEVANKRNEENGLIVAAAFGGLITDHGKMWCWRCGPICRCCERESRKEVLAFRQLLFGER